MKPVAFEYCRPDTLGEALDLLAERRERAAVLAGGMSLGPMLNLRMVRPERVIDISRLGGLDGIEVRGDRIVTGATVIQADALESEVIRKELPLLALALPWVGHFQTRNAGTLGGSVAHADPSAEIPLCAVVSGATVVLRSRRRERRVAPASSSPARSPPCASRTSCWLRSTGRARRRCGSCVRGDRATPRRFRHRGRRLRARLDGADRHRGWRSGSAASRTGRSSSTRRRSSAGRPMRRPRRRSRDTICCALDPMEDHTASADYRRALAQVLAERVVLRAVEDARRKRGRAA